MQIFSLVAARRRDFEALEVVGKRYCGNGKRLGGKLSAVSGKLILELSAPSVRR